MRRSIGGGQPGSTFRKLGLWERPAKDLPTWAMRIILAHDHGDGHAEPRTPRKRAVNLFVDADLLDEARRLRINISETLERRLRMIVKAELERRWLEENREAIEAYNRRVAEHGLLSDHAGLL